MEKKKILFVCRYNRLRSRIAEAYFNRINKNKNFKVKSAGLIKGQKLNPRTTYLIRKLGLDVSGRTNGLTSDLMQWQDLTVIVADTVPEKVFDKNKKYGKKVIVWKIKDPEVYNLENIRKVIDQIKKKVDLLIKQLENKK